MKVRQAGAINFFLLGAFQLENTYQSHGPIVKKYRFYQNSNNWKLERQWSVWYLNRIVMYSLALLPEVNVQTPSL